MHESYLDSLVALGIYPNLTKRPRNSMTSTSMVFLYIQDVISVFRLLSIDSRHFFSDFARSRLLQKSSKDNKNSEFWKKVQLSLQV